MRYRRTRERKPRLYWRIRHKRQMRRYSEGVSSALSTLADIARLRRDLQSAEITPDSIQRLAERAQSIASVVKEVYETK